MADRLTLSNDSRVGYHYDEKEYFFSFANESSAHTTSTVTLNPVFIAPASGRITDFYIGIAQPALSASGFVSGNVSAGLRINSVSILSTAPAITGPVATSALCVRQKTYGGTSAANLVSGVVNAASAAFAPGDMISVDYATVSGGSAAAGAPGKGLYVGIKVRYEAS